MGLLERLQTWGHKVASSHDAKREMIKSLAHSYNSNIDSINSSFDKERVAYLQQIEILREKVGQLQHELNGDLIEPEYGQFGFDQNGHIANALAGGYGTITKSPSRLQGSRRVQTVLSPLAICTRVL